MNKIKFAVTREDPIIEETIIKKFNCKKILMIASGGCSALSLKSMFPDIQFSLFDINPEQIKLIKAKLKNLKNFDVGSYKLFNIGSDSLNGLNSCGDFESLFRSFRLFIYEFVLSKNNVKKIFVEGKKQTSDLLLRLMTNKYWPVAFDLYFSNSMLITMFGKDAIQHAIPHSYPSYFRKAVELGFKLSDFQKNYFLQHIFLGYYLKEDSVWPYYLSHRDIKNDFHYINDNLLNIDISHYDFIGLSNIFDWMDECKVVNYLKYISLNAQKGTVILFRQLNNQKDYNLIRYGLLSHLELEEKLIKKDKSLFYNKINIITKK